LRCKGVCRNCSIGRIGHGDIARELDFMPEFRQRANRRARHVSVEEETHAESDGWQRMKRFLFSQLSYEFQSCANIIRRKIVFTLDLFKGHATGQAAYDHRYRHSRATNNRLAMMGGRIQDDAI
jgi:hypothetical protein